MTRQRILVVGGGMAGVSLGSELALDHDVVLLEAERSLGVHSTGRSAALFLAGYGPPPVRELTRRSEPEFARLAKVAGMSAPLTPRGGLFTAWDEPTAVARAALVAGQPSMTVLSADEARTLCPVLRTEGTTMCAFDAGARDIDVSALDIDVSALGDFECEYCGRAESAIRADLAVDDDVRYVWRHLPLTDVHPQAQLAAEAAEAAAAQGGFWPMHDLLLAHQDQLDPPGLLRHAREQGLDVQRFHDDVRHHEHAGRVAQDVESADLGGRPEACLGTLDRHLTVGAPAGGGLAGGEFDREGPAGCGRVAGGGQV